MYSELALSPDIGLMSPRKSDWGGLVEGLRETVLIHDLKKQGLSITAIERKVVCDRKTVRKYLERGLEAPVYGPRQSRERIVEPFELHLRQRVLAFPHLSGARILLEIREMGYEGGYTAVMWRASIAMADRSRLHRTPASHAEVGPASIPTA